MTVNLPLSGISLETGFGNHISTVNPCSQIYRDPRTRVSTYLWVSTLHPCPHFVGARPQHLGSRATSVNLPDSFRLNVVWGREKGGLHTDQKLRRRRNFKHRLSYVAGNVDLVFFGPPKDQVMNDTWTWTRPGDVRNSTGKRWSVWVYYYGYNSPTPFLLFCYYTLVQSK